MRRALAPLAAAALLAACSGDDDKPDKRQAPAPPAPAPKQAYSDPDGSFSLRYPEGWRVRTTRPLLLAGPGGGSCLVADAGALPDWTSSELRVAYVLRGVEALGDRAGLAPASAGVVRGANAEGAGAVADLRSEGRKRRSRTAVLASAGTGVALSCVASERSFSRLDREVFRPLIASVSVRREPKLEPVQAKVAAMSGVEAASLFTRAGAVQVELELRSPRRARFVSRAVLREVTDLLPGRDLRLSATADGRAVARGRYTYARRRGFVGFPRG